MHPSTYRRLERGPVPLTGDTAATLALLFNTPPPVTDAYTGTRTDR